MQPNLTFVKTLSSKMQEHKFMLSYRGNVSQEITKSLLALTERKLELDGTEISTKKKVFNVMLECLQNISKHSEESKNQRNGLFMIGKTETQYIVYSGNSISNANVNDLTTKLAAVNDMSREELSELYKKLIVENRMSDKGTAGLGIIDIAKKSGNKLEYKFLSLNETHSYFTLKTFINTN
jgi:Family of unknown function (DUF6272)